MATEAVQICFVTEPERLHLPHGVIPLLNAVTVTLIQAIPMILHLTTAQWQKSILLNGATQATEEQPAHMMFQAIRRQTFPGLQVREIPVCIATMTRLITGTAQIRSG